MRSSVAPRVFFYYRNKDNTLIDVHKLLSFYPSTILFISESLCSRAVVKRLAIISLMVLFSYFTPAILFNYPSRACIWEVFI